MTTSIVEVIRHYQRSIDSSQDNEGRLLHCINKLYKLPIKVEHLQETGVGKTVNSLRKFNGEIGVAAKSLVTKWKAMVAAEEEPIESTPQSNGNDNYNNDGGGGETNSHEEDDDENHNRKSNRHLQDENKRHSEDNKSKHKEKHKSRSSSSCHNHTESRKSSTAKLDERSSKSSHERQKCSSPKEKASNQSSSSKEKERDKSKTELKSSSEHHKNRDCENVNDRHDKRSDEKLKLSKEQKEGSPVGSTGLHHKSKSHSSDSKSKDTVHHSSSSSSKDKDRHGKHKSSSKDKETSSSKKLRTQHKSSPIPSTSKSSTKDPDSADRKRRNSGNDAADFKSPPPKAVKLHKPSSSTPGTTMESSSPTITAEEEGIDGSFDSSMGTNFDDVLGMLNVPVKKIKKSSKSPSTPSNSFCNTGKKEATTPSKANSGSSSSVGNKANESKTTHTSKSSHSSPSTSKASTMKPDLLAPTTKLEPLDPSIVLELPTISTNYRPMPLNQTVMDCVFNNSSSSTKPVRILSDAEALNHGISSKTVRTKIYSGVRTGQTFQVPSLFDMCIRILQKNIDALEYTGGVPFEVLKPVLERATPQQLYAFEEYNPYLMEDSDVLWQLHVSRNYRTKKRQENESWREMFIRCQEEEERRLSVLKDSIKASQKIAAAPIRKTQLAFVDSMVKPPRNILKKQEQFGTKAKLVATPAARVASLSSVTPNAVKTGDQRLRVSSAVKDHAQVSSSSIRPKKAPLMQKTLQFIRGRHKR